VGNGWTGGQFSILRAAAGLLACARLAALAAGRGDLELPLAAGLVAAPLLALGLRSREAAVVAALALVLAEPPAASPAVLCAWLALAPPRPFGSLAARGRPDPGGGWRLPQGALALARGALAVQVLVTAVEGVDAWNLATLVLLGLAACDPAWVPGRPSAGPDRLFYDGSCGLCHRTVRLLLAEDRSGRALRFAPIGGPTFEAAVPAEDRERLPDSLVLVTPEGKLLVRSRATLRALARLGGLWRTLAVAARAVPRPVADVVYDMIARVRGSLFATPRDTCPLIPPELRERFDD
jgi:predicted DCC family thiol-disulfide oxidoreductase YuxK